MDAGLLAASLFSGDAGGSTTGETRAGESGKKLSGGDRAGEFVHTLADVACTPTAQAGKTELPADGEAGEANTGFPIDNCRSAPFGAAAAGVQAEARPS